MSQPYARELIDRALEVARRENFVAHRGVFVAVSGPNLETRAELRFLRQNRGRLRRHVRPFPSASLPFTAECASWGLSAVTDLAFADCLKTGRHQRKFLHGAKLAEPKLRKIVLGVLEKERQPAVSEADL